MPFKNEKSSRYRAFLAYINIKFVTGHLHEEDSARVIESPVLRMLFRRRQGRTKAESEVAHRARSRLFEASSLSHFIKLSSG